MAAAYAALVPFYALYGRDFFMSYYGVGGTTVDPIFVLVMGALFLPLVGGSFFSIGIWVNNWTKTDIEYITLVKMFRPILWKEIVDEGCPR
jgi:hypothetical protein